MLREMNSREFHVLIQVFTTKGFMNGAVGDIKRQSTLRAGNHPQTSPPPVTVVAVCKSNSQTVPIILRLRLALYKMGEG